MRPEERQSESSVDELRIRLEGAFDVVEAAASRYAALEKILASGRWRKTLRLEPDLLDDLLRVEGSVRQAREKCERFVQSHAETAGPVPKALAKLSEARAALHQTTLRRLRSKTALSMEDALAQLSSRVLAEIPGNLRPGEKRLMEGGAAMQGWIIWLPMIWSFLIGSEPVADFLGQDGGAGLKNFIRLLVLGSVAVVFWMPFLLSWLMAGKYTLTNQRLIWTPRRGEQVQVELATLKPGAFSISPTLKHIKVDALEPFTMRAIENAPQLAAYAEMTRWMSAKLPGNAPLTDVAIFPAFDGEVAGWEESVPGSVGVAVMRPQFAAFFKTQDSSKVLKAITGYSPGKSVDLESALLLLRQLGDAQFDDVVQTAAKQHGVLMERSVTTVASEAPVWRHLIVRAPSRSFAAKVTWRHLEQVERMVSKWRTT